MMEGSTRPKLDADRIETPAARLRLWPWFLAGFLVVFVAMSLAITTDSIDPSGRGILSCPLWRYYIVEVQRAAASSGALGPASGSSLAAVVTAIQHVLCSSVGGLAVVGIAWAVRRSRARRRES